MTSEDYKTKKLIEIILNVGRVTSLKRRGIFSLTLYLIIISKSTIMVPLHSSEKKYVSALDITLSKNYSGEIK